MKCVHSQFTIMFVIVALSVTSFLGMSVCPAHAQAPPKKEYAEKVKREFLFAWNDYKKYAWGHDELRPLSSYRPPAPEVFYPRQVANA